MLSQILLTRNEFNCGSLIMRGCRLDDLASLFRMAFFGLPGPLIRNNFKNFVRIKLSFYPFSCISCNKKFVNVISHSHCPFM